MGVRASMATTYYEDNYRGYRHHYPRTGHHQKKDFWGADYPVAPAVTPQTLGVFPAAYDRGVARRWRTEALTSAPPPIPPPATCPSPHKLIGREADISEAVGFMSMEHHMHPHAGATPAHSCVHPSLRIVPLAYKVTSTHSGGVWMPPTRLVPAPSNAVESSHTNWQTLTALARQGLGCCTRRWTACPATFLQCKARGAVVTSSCRRICK